MSYFWWGWRGNLTLINLRSERVNVFTNWREIQPHNIDLHGLNAVIRKKTMRTWTAVALALRRCAHRTQVGEKFAYKNSEMCTNEKKQRNKIMHHQKIQQNKLLVANYVRFPFTYSHMFRDRLCHVLFETCWDQVPFLLFVILYMSPHDTCLALPCTVDILGFNHQTVLHETKLLSLFLQCVWQRHIRWFGGRTRGAEQIIVRSHKPFRPGKLSQAKTKLCQFELWCLYGNS